MICGIIKTNIFKKSNTILNVSLLIFIFSIFLLFNNIFISIEIPFLSLFYSQLNIRLNLDWLSILFLASVLFITSIIIKFSYSYISLDQHNIFINLLLIFVLSIRILIIRNNIIFILLGWDGLGLSSYILVVYYQNSSSSASGSITILSNRIGDIIILIRIATLFSILNWNFCINELFIISILIFLTIAAISKRAQFPFSAWLPAAISAPTPISALVHSSTLVTAGVYLLLRIINFNHPYITIILILISSFTAIYARLAAIWEQDIKKIIALSTLRQMAIIIFAISLNSINIAYFHLISHALFKSIIFLCAGILIHNFIYQDIRHIGSIYKYRPIPITILGISNLSLIGIPFISGFFSKDSIIEKIIYSNITILLTILIIISISITSIYSFRLINITTKFYRKSKPDNNLLTNYSIENPTIYIASFSIIFGILYLWIYSPNQLFIIPNIIKFIILSSLLLGIITAISLSFKNKNYLNIGQSAISLWFTHILSSNYIFNINYSIKQFSNNDKLWQESYGPTNSFYINISSSYIPNILILSSICILIITILIPIIFYS